jgi:hypothetical protein
VEIATCRLHPAHTANAAVLQPGGLSLTCKEEDDMPVRLNPACLLCGLRFPNRPLLDLHIREDHREPRSPGHDDPDRLCCGP